jgi:hypothetical protein
MDVVEKANSERRKRWCVYPLSSTRSVSFLPGRTKDKKIGEGTYAVVYQG